MTTTEFNGFPEEGFRFLRQLKRNNDRDWFRERKQDYATFVQEPMRQLVVAVSAACCAKGIPLHAKEKNPVFRVYRDTRFSKDKAPFKTHVGADLRKSFVNSECLLYIHISPEESFLGAGVWQTGKDLLQAWRTKIVHAPQQFEKMVQALDRGKLALTHEHSLSSMPRGYRNFADQPIGPWLKLTSFIVRRPLKREECLSAGLVKTVANFAIAAKPLLEYAWAVEGDFMPARERLLESALV